MSGREVDWYDVQRMVEDEARDRRAAVQAEVEARRGVVEEIWNELRELRSQINEVAHVDLRTTNEDLHDLKGQVDELAGALEKLQTNQGESS